MKANQPNMRFAPVCPEIQALGERIFRRTILADTVSTKAQRTRNAFANKMNEAILFPGTTFLVTSRGFAYQWLKTQGWSESERGFGSLDYAIFSQKAVSDPLTDEASRDQFLNKVRDDFARKSQQI